MKSYALVVILSCLAAAVSGVPTVKKSSIVIGDHVYFTDAVNIFRNREQALDFCLSQGGELAKVTNRLLYDQLRLSLTTRGAYWIDGIDKESLDRFGLNSTCTSGEFDPSGFTPSNLRLPAKSCLSLVKGNSASESRIEAMDCIIPHRVLCSYPLEGCDDSGP